jgi:hypothetical protein
MRGDVVTASHRWRRKDADVAGLRSAYRMHGTRAQRKREPQRTVGWRGSRAPNLMTLLKPDRLMQSGAHPRQAPAPTPD